MVVLTAEIRAARAKWRYRGSDRPPFAKPPGAMQESVWDYPRPPRLEADARRVRVLHGHAVLADSNAALRVLETASPPTFYLPPEDVEVGLLQASGEYMICEWKGLAQPLDIAATGGRPQLRGGAWTYVDTFPEFDSIRGFFAFYPAKVRCTVDDAVAQPQPGGYYGGWATAEVVGPFKGEAGSEGW